MEKRVPEQPVSRAALTCRLGLISFPEALELERRLLKMRAREKISDIFLIFEHPPTVTLGRFGNIKNVLATREELEKKGIALYDADRGGDVTYNCPGQLVIHPIISVKLKGARAFIGELEEVSLCVLRSYNIPAERSPIHPGIWVKGKQIGAVGLRFSRGVSMYGMSLSVNPDLELFKVVNLCGLPDKSATSIAKELSSEVSVDEVKSRVEAAFSGVFQVSLSPISRVELDKLIREHEQAKDS